MDTYSELNSKQNNKLGKSRRQSYYTALHSTAVRTSDPANRFFALWNQKVYFHVGRNQQLGRVFSQFRSIHIFAKHFRKIIPSISMFPN
jgi:hypothetical protein